MSTLYVVATPIGNLDDITLRAMKVLRQVSLIAAEDTRRTARLLNAYDIKTPLTSYFEHNKLSKLDFILEKLLTADVALVSDAGMPGISDPGHELIVAALEKNIRVEAIPGPSALLSALAVSGLPTDGFSFIGFLPRRSRERRAVLQGIAARPDTLVFFEAPHRIAETLADMLHSLGDRRLAVCRELTKMHEEVFRGTVGEALSHFDAPRGEFVLVVAGAPAVVETLSEEEGLKLLVALKKQGLTAREAVAEAAAVTGLSRKWLYQTWLEQ
jgi:16S rRNA (cytidine1402-2'-O)-methyltransferase